MQVQQVALNRALFRRNREVKMLHVDDRQRNGICKGMNSLTESHDMHHERGKRASIGGRSRMFIRI